MPLQATSGAASYDGFGGGVAAVPNYIEECFSTTLYTGNGSTQTITNGIDLSTKGGLVWFKSRSSALSNSLFDTARGTGVSLLSNSTVAEQSDPTGLTAFTTSGFTVGSTDRSNGNGLNIASWTFRKQPKFFDVVTWTGNGSSTQTINHNLGSTPGCIIIKVTSQADDWYVYHRSLSQSGGVPYWLNLNSTAAQQFFGGGIMLSADPTSTTFTVKGGVNGSGNTYVAYVFAHNAGGFGLTGTDNVISCGSFTASGGAATVNLGYEPQWLMFKQSDGGTPWSIIDNMRGWSFSAVAELKPNSSAAEDPNAFIANPTATGFSFGAGTLVTSGTYIYIAIRRGPMKVPTTGTSVFSPNASNAPTDGTQITTGFPTDLSMWKSRGGSYSGQFQDRLRGLPSTAGSGTATLYPDSTAAESSNQTGYQYWNTGFKTYSGENNIWWSFRRAPNTFDEVCYTGNDTLRTINHNLGVAPEMMIIKCRDSALDWAVYHTGIGNTKYIFLNSTAASVTASSYWNDTSPTASVFTVNTSNKVNSSPSPYVAYLWATNAGVTKVGTYTGNGSSQTINCGFTGGARFVMIKATSTTGNWLVADSARGIVSGNDPALYLNSTSAEVTGFDWIDADNSGFIVNETSTIAANTNGVQYLFLAYA